MVLSVMINFVTAVIAVWAVTAHTRKSPAKIVFRFFTVLSNLFCAAASLAVGIARLCGTVPTVVLALKFVGTAAVAVTFFTVMLFLGPVVYNYKLVLSGPDFWLHLICPVLAIASVCIWDKPNASFAIVFLGVLPVLLYGGWYLYHILLAPPEKRWEDFYGFNRGGKWRISFAAMVLASLLISLLLWLI